MYLREVLQESKMGSKQIRVWSTSQTEVLIVQRQLDRLRDMFEMSKKCQMEQLSNVSNTNVTATLNNSTNIPAVESLENDTNSSKLTQIVRQPVDV
jgi:hypothetical protein